MRLREVDMRLISTRGETSPISFTEALLQGLARDGGLYVPEAWPVLSEARLQTLNGAPYTDAAEAVVGALTGGSFAPDVLSGMIRDSYSAFRHPAVCPLIQICDNLFVQELFRGPTLAFKDVAMRLLARMINHELSRTGQRATIAGATSGDTGSAAIDAFGGLPTIDIFTLFPHGRVSEVQRRQMTTPSFANSKAMAIDGTFDDCQALIKSMFNHTAFRDRVKLSGVNSINWGRIAAQAVYYFTAAASLTGFKRPVSFSVPTGNFGDVFAGYVAKCMGLPVDRLIVATNRNDILARTIDTGRYEVLGVSPTTSPSMDIQVSSNFERLLFEAGGRDPAMVRRCMSDLASNRYFTVPGDALQSIRNDFEAHAVDEAGTSAEIAHVYRECGYVLDPHTAIGVTAARRRLAVDPTTPVVVMGTADPAKFPDVVREATGIHPALPAHMSDLFNRTEHVTRLANDQADVEAFIATHTSVASHAEIL
jgi:threonine synthase